MEWNGKVCYTADGAVLILTYINTTTDSASVKLFQDPCVGVGDYISNYVGAEWPDDSGVCPMLGIR